MVTKTKLSRFSGVQPNFGFVFFSERDDRVLVVYKCHWLENYICLAHHNMSCEFWCKYIAYSSRYCCRYQQIIVVHTWNPRQFSYTVRLDKVIANVTAKVSLVCSQPQTTNNDGDIMDGADARKLGPCRT